MFSKKNFMQLALVTTVFALAAATTSYRASRLGNRKPMKNADNCEALLGSELIAKIASYQTQANQIIEFITTGDFKGRTYKELADLCDLYPSRPSGYQVLEDSIDYMMTRMSALGLENVRGEQVTVPHWVRGEESASIVSPINKPMAILGLGFSVGTPANGITAEVLVVKTFAELQQMKDKVPGKIVVYNQGWLGDYGSTVAYRGDGAAEAAKFGAIATLVESVAPFSLNTPHTGGQNYQEGVPYIPTACITKEDADLLYRLQQRGDPVKVTLKMLDMTLPMTTSRNVIGEITGKEAPSEYVGVSGHVDSWDVGQGAMDDGGGVMISVMALAALKELGLRPNRTLEAILWTAEEMGLWGVQDFVRQHKDDKLANYSVVFESDSGTFKPKGLDFAGTEKAGCIVNEVLKLLSSINAQEYNRFSSVGSDISFMVGEGVPGLSLNNENDKYFWYHHTPADMISMIDSDELDLDTAVWAVTSYVLADIPVKLPREGE